MTSFSGSKNVNRKELYQNVRKAYRLVYEVQDSIVATAEYIRTKIKFSKWGGGPLFSAAVAKKRVIEDGYTPDQIGGDMWSWDYFPTYMYMYYYELLDPSEHQYCCFSIIQVMDDGFKVIPDAPTPPSTKAFIPPEKSESYLLFAFSLWNKGEQELWFTFDGVDYIRDEKSEILRISKLIDEQGTPYVTSLNEHHFIVMKVPLEEIGNKVETDEFLQKFSDLIIAQTNYQILNEG